MTATTAFRAAPGDDTLAGGAGGDLYTYRRGDGADTIQEAATAQLEIDRVDFPDFVSTEVSVTRLFKGSDSLRLSFASAPGDSLVIIDALAGGRAGIEQFTFADGVLWSAQTLEDLLANNAPVAQSDGYYSVTEGESLTLAAATLLRNDYDANGDR